MIGGRFRAVIKRHSLKSPSESPRFFNLKTQIMKIVNDFRKYRLTLQHDKGKINLIVIASSEADAIQQACKAENCPPGAVIKTKVFEKVLWSMPEPPKPQIGNEDEGFFEEQAAASYVKKRKEDHGTNLVGWVEERNGKFFPAFNLYD